MEGRRDATPLSKRLSRVEFLGEMISFLHSFVLLSVSLITPNPLLPRGRRGFLVFRKPKTKEGT